jgi:transcriptional regulator with XRE-family HTH domain
MNDTNLARLFGLIVRRMRSEAGFSQEEFATRCHLHRTYVGSIERGEKNVTLTTAHKIARALGVQLSDLVVQMEQNNTDDKHD